MKVVDIGAKTLDIDNASILSLVFVGAASKVELIGFEPQDENVENSWKNMPVKARRSCPMLSATVRSRRSINRSIPTFVVAIRSPNPLSSILGIPIPRPDINPLKKYKPAAWTIFRRRKERIF